MEMTQYLTEQFTAVVQELCAQQGVDANTINIPRVTRAGKPEFGDYQFNGAMAMAKPLKMKPRDIASHLVDRVKLNQVAQKLEIAGPGFINIHLDSEYIATRLVGFAQDVRGLFVTPDKQTVVVDLSSPNLAKEMHVGHLRSTIIGDAAARLLELQGHRVIRQNHMGDWGTQFGMLLAHLHDRLTEDVNPQHELSDLEAFYREAKQRFDDEPGFADRAREFVVKLQAHDPSCLSLWRSFIEVSIAHSDAVYQKLGVSLTRADIRGESAYNDDLAPLVDDLLARDIAVVDQGAVVVFLPEISDKEGNQAVYIVRKSGGGYLYATTDLAAIRYRANQLDAQRTLIFTDARQALHFKQTELVARKAGYLKPTDRYQHCPFGMMLGNDGKPFKTRSGGTVKLNDLLDEAIDRASQLLAGREHEFSSAELAQLSRDIGISAIKYADLSKHRTTDYVFDWDAMLSFDGNTAPYLQYALTRILSLFNKAGVQRETLRAQIQRDDSVLYSLTEVAEHQLAVQLLHAPTAFEQATQLAEPHLICNYLYELSTLLMRFYECCPVLKEGVEEATRASRLALLCVTSDLLELGLNTLGIATPKRM